MADVIDNIWKSYQKTTIEANQGRIYSRQYLDFNNLKQIKDVTRDIRNHRMPKEKLEDLCLALIVRVDFYMKNRVVRDIFSDDNDISPLLK